MTNYKTLPEPDRLSEEVPEGGCCSTIFPSGYTKELKSTLKIAWAIVLTQILDINFQPIAVMFGGHLGKLELDSIALANTLINVLGCSIVIGMSSSCETVFSQCYGYGNYKMVGVFLQRSLYIHILAMLLCYAIHLNITKILIAAGQDPEVSEEAGRYLLYFMPGLMCYCLATVIRKYTQCQNIVIPHIFILGMGHVLHAVCQYLFLYQFKLGIIGSALAQDATFFFILVATIIYTLCSKAHKESWPGWDWRGLTEWGPLVRLALYGLLMVCFEWWAFELSILIAGTIGNTELGAQSIAFQLDSMYYGCIYGIGIATTVRVGQLLGAGRPIQAKTSARVGLTITGVMALTMATIFISARHELPKLFTGERDVIDMVAGVLPILAVYASGNAIIVIVRGVFRGIGWQRLGSVLSFVSFYVLAWPIAAPLVFLTSLGIKGLWLGFMVGIVLSGLCHLLIMGCLRWETLSEEAIARANAEIDSQQQGIRQEVQPTESTYLKRSTSSSMHGDTNQAEKVDDKSNLSDSNQSEYEVTKKTSGGIIIKRLMTLLVFLLIIIASVILRITTGTGTGPTDSFNNMTTVLYDDITTGIYNMTTL